MAVDSKEYKLLPHHEQMDLCTTRLPYRQGRKLTAMKVYSINNESKHLLVFGVPSLNLRQETKALFSRFGKLQFNLTKYPAEPFTETYHAVFEDIQSARIAKKMLDTKSYYGGVLHICYAPELESVQETREKLMLRQKNVVARLKNLQKDTVKPQKSLDNKVVEEKVDNKNSDDKIFMGDVNSIKYDKKRKATDFKSVQHKYNKKSRNIGQKNSIDIPKIEMEKTEITKSNINFEATSSNIEIVDFTSVDTDILTNINESLNYNNFGTEIIKEVPYKPVNKIKFNLNKNS